MTILRRAEDWFGRPWVRSTAAGLAGFLGYGGWAFWVNMSHGTAMGVRAGLVQGGYSFALTFISTSLMEVMLRVFRRAPQPGLITITLTMILLFVTAYSINWIAGTPEILMTILPGFVIGSVYTAAYVVTVQRTLG